MAELKDKELEQVDAGFYGPSEIRDGQIRDTDLAEVDGGIWFKPAPSEADGLAPDIIIIDEASNDSMVFPQGSIDTAAPKGWE